MTINIIRPSDYPVPLSPKYKAPAVAFSAKNTIILNPSLCIAMGLDESHDHILFGYDKNYPTDLYIRKAAADQLEDAFTLLDRKIQAVECKGFVLQAKKSLGLAAGSGYKFPVRSSQDGWFCIGVKRARCTDKNTKK